MSLKQRIAAYCRVSTYKEDQANSLLSQRNYFFSYITSHPDWQLVQVYYDEGISGTQTRNRDGFNEMIASALRGEVDLILTKEVSRFARNTVDTLSCTRKLKQAGVGVIFILDHIDTRDSDGELRLTIMASLAQEESRKTSERVKWGQKRRMEAGVVFGRDLLGYRVRKGKLTVNESEAEQVRLIFRKYTNEGKGACLIARELETEGVRTREGKSWSSTAILRILRNEKYVGDLCQKKTITPDYLTHGKKYNHGEEEMVYLRNHHEPIIDRVLWERTQEELLRRSGLVLRHEKHSSRYWCSGKLFCGECGSRYIIRKKRRADGSVNCCWRCRQAAQHGAAKKRENGAIVGCSNEGINDRALFSVVKACLQSIPLDWVGIKEELLRDLRTMQEQGWDEGAVEKLKTEIERIREKKRKTIDLVVEGVISKEEFMSQNQWYETELESLEKKRRAIEKEEVRRLQEEGMQVYGRVLDEIIDCKEPGELLCREILDRIVICRGNTLNVWFQLLPFGFHVKVHTHGRKNFITDILEIQPVET